MEEKYAIWWLNQAACEEIKPLYRTGNLDLPEYIIDQFVSRYGRAGRGRLWVAGDIPVTEIPWDDNKMMCQIVVKFDSGGIVIKADDIPGVAALPGFVTDLDMSLWRIEND